MPGQFESIPGGGAAVALDEVEISIIRFFAEGPSEPPSDPVLQRLLPDAYGGPGSEGSSADADELRAYSSEFRRFTENDLRAKKRDDALVVIRSLDSMTSAGDGGAVLKLSAEESRHWLGALNDLRLAIGARLEVTDEDDTDLLYQLPDSDARKPMVMAYLWLGGLQETLVSTLIDQ